MKKIMVLFAAGVFGLAFAGCGGGEEAPSNEVEIGGFGIEGPAGRDIFLPEVTAEREDVENYVQSVQPIIEESARGLPQFVDPQAALQNETLLLAVEVEAVEEARATAQSGLEALQVVEPPEALEPINELLIATYVQAIASYDNIIDAFESGDVDVLSNALQENLPEIEQFTVETRAVLLELARIETVNPDDQVESRG